MRRSHIVASAVAIGAVATVAAAVFAYKRRLTVPSAVPGLSVESPLQQPSTERRIIDYDRAGNPVYERDLRNRRGGDRGDA